MHVAHLRGHVGLVDPVPGVRGVRPVLTLVPQPNADRLTEARELLRLVESAPDLQLIVELFLLPLLAVCLLATGFVWAWALIGAALALALRRYGPHWWPGKR
jgi:hypothetical protein